MEIQVPVDKVGRLQMVELDVCVRCSHCADYCPAYQELRRPGVLPGGRATLLLRLVASQKGLWARVRGSKGMDERRLRELSKDLYDCTLCGRCMIVCPFGIQTDRLWETFREILYGVKQHPESLREVDTSIREQRNPYAMDQDTRSMWTDYLSLDEAPLNKPAKLAYFVGCTSSFKAPAQDIAYATSLLLRHVGEDWSLLGEGEWCCGGPSLMIGDEGSARELALHNVEVIESLGVERVVSSCPTCFKMLRHIYPHLIGRRPRFRVQHAVELFARHLDEGRLRVEGRETRRIGYHDPCELARQGGVVEEPRRILSEVAERGVELPESRFDVRCCGGGGMLQAVNNDLRLQIAQGRIHQAEQVGVEVLTSACPACKITLMEAAKVSSGRLEVLDLMEILARQLELL